MNVALGVGGGIAAYKAAELARALMERGFSVQVLMTAAAEEFIRPLTFASLTGKKVITSLFAAGSGASEHGCLSGCGGVVADRGVSRRWRGCRPRRTRDRDEDLVLGGNETWKDQNDGVT